MNLYTITFVDGTIFLGGDLINTHWQEIPDKKIKRISYNFPHKDYLILNGYEYYYHFIEVCEDLTGLKRGIMQLEYAYLIGKEENKYRIYKISLKNYQKEIIDTDQNNELIKQLNPIGWKKGI